MNSPTSSVTACATALASRSCRQTYKRVRIAPEAKVVKLDAQPQPGRWARPKARTASNPGRLRR